MHTIYVVVKGQKDYYLIDKIFHNKEDAEKYIEYIQFYTHESLWIIESDINENYVKEDKGDPLITAHVNIDNRVFKVEITNYSKSNKEQRFSNFFTFFLERYDGENLQDFLKRAKRIAIKKQLEYLNS